MCIRDSDTLVVKDIPSPVPGPKQVLVKVEAASVNFPDALMVQGLYPVSYTHLTLPTSDLV